MSAATATTAPPALRAKVDHGGKTAVRAARSVLSAGSLRVTCASAGTVPAATGRAVIPSGRTHGRAPLEIGTITRLSLAGCTGPAGQVTMRARALPYGIKVNSPTRKGQTDVVVSGLTVTVSMTGCAFTISGSVPGYYANKTHTLTLTPDLPVKPLTPAQAAITHIKGCTGLVHLTISNRLRWYLALGIFIVVVFTVALLLL